MVNHMKVSIDKIALGITEDDVVLGSHLIHFWNTEEGFERGVQLLANTGTLFLAASMPMPC